MFFSFLFSGVEFWGKAGWKKCPTELGAALGLGTDSFPSADPSFAEYIGGKLLI